MSINVQKLTQDRIKLIFIAILITIKTISTHSQSLI